MNMHDPNIKLVPLTRGNWERALDLKLTEDQEKLIPGTLFSLAQSAFEPGADRYGIYADTTMVGFALVYKSGGVYWIARFMIDAQHQGKGYGRRALEALLQRIVTRPDYRELRTSMSAKNAAAEYLFTRHGFRRTGELDDLEIVLKKEL